MLLGKIYLKGCTFYTYHYNTNHMVEQSKFTSSHLCGLMSKLSAYWIPFNICLYSGQIQAEPVNSVKFLFIIEGDEGINKHVTLHITSSLIL